MLKADRKGGERNEKSICYCISCIDTCYYHSFSCFCTDWLFLGQNSYSYNGNKACVCTLTKPGKKDAKVTVKLTTSNCALSVKMADAKGRHIWSENYSMGVGANKKYRSKRTYVLGKDHAVYQLYFKATNGKGTGFCSVNDPKNCTIK